MAQITQPQLVAFVNSKDGLTSATRADFTKFPNPAGSGTISVTDLSGLDFSYLNMLSANNGNGVNLSNTRWVGTTVNNIAFNGDSTNLNNYNGAYFEKVNGNSPYFGIQPNFNYSNFNNATFKDCNLSNGAFSYCTFTAASMKNCDFSKTFFNSTLLELMTIESCNFTGSTIQTNARLNGLTVINCDFTDVGFAAIFTSVTFINCNFTDSRFAFNTTTPNQTIQFDNCVFEQVVFNRVSSVTLTFLPNCNVGKTLFF